jgi:DNA-binding NtrC family response regulator
VIGLRFLIIESDVEFSRKMAESIEKMHSGSRGTLHATGREALSSALQDQYDVAVINSVLADLPTEQVVNEISRMDPSLPVIVISDDRSDSAIGDIFKSGAVALLAKDETLCDILPRVVAKCCRRIDSPHRNQRLVQAVGAE